MKINHGQFGVLAYEDDTALGSRFLRPDPPENGRESYSVIADGLERKANTEAERVKVLRSAADKILASDSGSVREAARSIAEAHKHEGRAEALREVAAMLRAGRVTP
jgi:hypothetical protein